MKEEKEKVIEEEIPTSEEVITSDEEVEQLDYITSIEPKSGIEDSTRKIITNAALVYVLSMMFNMFSVFLPFAATQFIPLSLNIVNNLALYLMGFGFLKIYKKENNRTIFITTIIIFVGATINIASQVVAISYIYAFPSLVTMVFKLPQDILVIPSLETGSMIFLVINITTMVSLACFTVGFYQLKKVVDIFAIQKRNIFKGQLSLPLGYLFLTLRYILDTAIPQDFLFEEVGGQMVAKQGASILIYLLYFLDMGSVIMMVLGFWYLRRAFLTLDKVNAETFERIEEARRQAAEARQARGQTGGRFGRRGLGGGLFGGGIAPPPQVKTEPQEELELLEEEEDIKDKKMFCVKCGLELEVDAIFCAECGEENPYLKKGK